ncbi:class I SAM-dependent methyltransferase [Naasia sp. SYSU D00057]|uniref:class I SAM-dependent methyltransferase n=1 Tax=Naasia sp. SYSU D00057 TaxID=2817380 RepID=UPI001B3133B4|nr:class I SAM-dependent methyltransferase [Naasia sp. SYSU D00057]
MDDDRWSAVAADWARLWGRFAGPAREALVAAAAIGPGTRVLDVGCGSGEFLRLLQERGARATGIDDAPGMVEIARSAVPSAEVRVGDALDLPWPYDSFDAVVAVNALELTGDPELALAEAMRVTVPGGVVAVANWAEGARNDVDAIEAAVAEAYEEEPSPDGPLRLPGGLERLLTAAGLDVVASGTVPAVWEAADEDALVRGILLGEDDAGLAAAAPVVVAAAEPFRTAGGGYRLVNAFRFAVGRVPVR